MNAFEAFQLYVALKNHFTDETYDYFKYNGKTRVSVHSFETRKDKYHFHRLSKHKDPLGVLISNFIDKGSVWVGDLDYKDTYEDWLRRNQSRTYIFEQELRKLNPNFAANFATKDGQHPQLLRLILRKEVSLETVILLQNLLNFFDTWREQIKDPILWPTIYKRLYKYQPFVKCDIKKIREIALKHFKDMETV